MCVWCAYTGKRAAAPVLKECAKRIEGLWSGFYSGLVTQEADGLLMKKTDGCTRFWDAKFNLDEFQGTCGLWHSRTASGGDWRFAHPFVGVHGQVALVSQGSAGAFEGRRELQTALMNKCLAEGMVFPSASEPQGRKYNVLSDGTQIHCSDFVTQFIEREYMRTGDPLVSLRNAFTQYQEEASSIVIFKDYPGRIYFETTSQRIVMAKYADGIGLAITSLAFGPTPLKTMELPTNCIGYVEQDKLVVEKLSPIYDNVDEQIPAGMMAAARNYLKANGPSLLAYICDGAIKPLFPETSSIKCSAVATYRALEELYFNREIEIIPEEVSYDGIITGRADKIKLV